MPIRITAALLALLFTSCHGASGLGSAPAAGPGGWTPATLGMAPSSATAAWSPWAPGTRGQGPVDDEADDGGGGVLHSLLFYIPNRLLDVFDIVRARVRLGPGVAVGARVTELADVYIGTYASVYVGLPGPRGRRMPRLPVGFESKSGVEASVADVTAEGGIGPDYGEFECGLGLQLLIVGFDVGVEPFEILDLVAGLIFFDPRGDDF